MDNPDAAYAPITLTLSADEALVLFEWLVHADDDAAGAARLPVERLVLHALLTQLERTLVAPFDARYAELLRHARDRVAAAS